VPIAPKRSRNTRTVSPAPGSPPNTASSTMSSNPQDPQAPHQRPPHARNQGRHHAAQEAWQHPPLTEGLHEIAPRPDPLRRLRLRATLHRRHRGMPPSGSLSTTARPARCSIAPTPSPRKNAKIERAFVLIHGASRDADQYFRTAVSAAFLAGASTTPSSSPPALAPIAATAKHSRQRRNQLELLRR
jgi:hypothetical protein